MTKSLYAFLSTTRLGRMLAAFATPHQNKAEKTKEKYAEKEFDDDGNSEENSSKTCADYAKMGDKFLDGKLWTVLSVVCTITSLLAYDFTIAFLPKSVDMSTDIILLIVFAFFFVELIVASLVRRGYFLSFWFWLDFIAMISMIPDLALLLSLFGAGDGEINVANTQASKAGKSGRSAVALKAIRMIRFSRLLRVLRVFKYFQTEDEEDGPEIDPVDAGSSKVGQIVSESVTKKVIILVLVLVLVLPWMDPSGASYAESATTASLLFKTCVENQAVDTAAALRVFEGVGVPVLKIVIDGEAVLEKTEEIALRRPVEVWGLSLNSDDEDDYILFDIRGNVLEEAALGMCLTLFAILIFASSTLFVTASTMSLVVAPVARLTELLTKMAGVIGLLGGAATVENMMEDNDELFIVEALCERIMDIFGTGGSSQQTTSHGSPGKGKSKKGSKALSMMATRKITQITSGDRVWEIDVKEKHRTSVIESRVNRSFKDFVRSKNNMDAISEDEDEKSDDQPAHGELASLRQIVDNPITLYCLRMFMTSSLTINNLLFVLEAEEWAAEARKTFGVIYGKFCDDASAAQINLTATQFGKLGAIEQGKEALSEDAFEDAVFETWELMERNIYHQFLESDFCRFYLFMKQHDPLTLNQLQLSVPAEQYDDNVERQMIRNSGSVDSGR